MKIKVATNELVFRISRLELAGLFEGKPLELCAPWSPGKLIFQVDPTPEVSTMCQLACTEGKVQLKVSLSQLKTLDLPKPPRDGLVHSELLASGSVLKTRLEVDIKDRG